MFLNTLAKKIEAICKITIFWSGIINLLFDGLAFNTSSLLAKYPHVLYAKPSNEVYLFNRKLHCNINLQYYAMLCLVSYLIIGNKRCVTLTRIVKIRVNLSRVIFVER